jgi:hypothetical protein
MHGQRCVDLSSLSEVTVDHPNLEGGNISVRTQFWHKANQADAIGQTGVP